MTLFLHDESRTTLALNLFCGSGGGVLRGWRVTKTWLWGLMEPWPHPNDGAGGLRGRDWRSGGPGLSCWPRRPRCCCCCLDWDLEHEWPHKAGLKKEWATSRHSQQQVVNSIFFLYPPSTKPLTLLLTGSTDAGRLKKKSDLKLYSDGTQINILSQLLSGFRHKRAVWYLRN